EQRDDEQERQQGKEDAARADPRQSASGPDAAVELTEVVRNAHGGPILVVRAGVSRTIGGRGREASQGRRFHGGRLVILDPVHRVSISVAVVLAAVASGCRTPGPERPAIVPAEVWGSRPQP